MLFKYLIDKIQEKVYLKCEQLNIKCSNFIIYVYAYMSAKTLLQEQRRSLFFVPSHWPFTTIAVIIKHRARIYTAPSRGELKLRKVKIVVLVAASDEGAIRPPRRRTCAHGQLPSICTRKGLRSIVY